MMSCTADILLEPSFTYAMTYNVNDRAMSCDAALDES